MNGTAVMTALACLAYVRAEYLLRLTTRITRARVLRSRRQRGPLRRDVIFESNRIAGQQAGGGVAAPRFTGSTIRRPTANGCRIVIRSAARPM